jgi:hypothetical protein
MAEEVLFKIIIRQSVTITLNKGSSAGKKSQLKAWPEELFVLLLMTVFSQSFFSLVRCNFMAFTLLTTRHTENSF